MNSRRGILSILLGNFFSNMGVTYWLIIINTAIFFILSLITLVSPDFVNYVALKPSDLFHFKNIWTLLTSMFVHANFGHLFVNMFSLFFIGSFVEKLIGRKRYFWFYIISGIFAGLFFSFLAYYFGSYLPNVFSTSETMAVGASGAIFGLLGILAVLIPKGKVYLLGGPFIAIIIESILAIFIKNPTILSFLDLIIMFYVFISIFLMMSFNPRLMKIAVPINLSFWLLPFVAIVPLIIIGLFVSLPIGNMAHLGGLIAGLIYGWYLRNKYKKKVVLLNKYVQK